MLHYIAHTDILHYCSIGHCITSINMQTLHQSIGRMRDDNE